jgi:glycosyltransferase involved in cell wall biosynthesis
MLVVNCRFLSQKVTGTQKFAIEICKELYKEYKDTIFIAPPSIVQKDIADTLNVKIVGIRFHKVVSLLGLPANLLWEQLFVPFYLRKYGSKLPLLNLVNVAPILYNYNYVVLHDTAFKKFPQFFNKYFVILYNVLVPIILKKAQQIFTVSYFSKSEIENYYPFTKGKIKVIYNAIDENVKKNREDIQKEPYILTVGSLEPRKNISKLISAMNLNKNIKLIIVGDKNTKIFDNNDFNIESNNIIFTGYIGDEQLKELYENATLFIYPSIYEGFGIPPLEAQNYGIPVIVSDIEVFREIYADSVYYVNPYTSEQMYKGIQKVYNDKELQFKLKAKGYENVKRYSWKNSAKKMIECLK